MAILEASNLTREYDGQAVLSGVSLSIEKGEALALIGPTGAGKTTIIRLLDLLDSPTSGGITFDGADVINSSQRRLEARRRMAYVQQKPTAFSMSVFDNVACGLKWRGQKGKSILSRVEKALELVGMKDYSRRNARTLSGGETQRVAIARAMVTEPEVLFLDEPTANLDPHSTLRIEEVIAGVVKEKKTAVVMATHDMVQGQLLANRIGVIIKGRLLQTGSPNDIFSAPESRELAEFVGIENILPGNILGRDGNLATVSISSREIQAISGNYNAGNDVYVLVRPEDIIISTEKAKSSARNNLDGVVTRLAPAGPLMRIEADCGFPLLSVVTRSAAEDLDLHPGQRIYASFKATAAHTIKRLS